MENILVAGRNVSSDQLALSSARVMTTCAMMGTAAGITLGYCIDKRINLQYLIGSQIDVCNIREILQYNDLILDLEYYK